ncbi:MAG: hypothetical protein HY673_16690 [Chloroflexi bacterium]|nr:hypothetical protein [Chloroflexota bacterium]
MEPDETERRFLENRLAQIEKELESRKFQLALDYPAEKPLPDGAGSEIFRYEVEKELVRHLLAGGSTLPLEERLIKLIESKARDQVELVEEKVARRAYPDQFWSDEFYIEILRDLLEDWADFRVME